MVICVRSRAYVCPPKVKQKRNVQRVPRVLRIRLDTQTFSSIENKGKSTIISHITAITSATTMIQIYRPIKKRRTYALRSQWCVGLTFCVNEIYSYAVSREVTNLPSVVQKMVPVKEMGNCALKVLILAPDANVKTNKVRENINIGTVQTIQKFPQP